MSKSLFTLLVISFIYFHANAQSFHWANKVNGSLDIVASVSDDKGNVYITGDFKDTVDFDLSPKIADTFMVRSNGSSDIFIAKYGPSGNLKWVQHFGSNSTREDEAKAICFDNSGNICVTGFFDNTVDFNFGTGVNNLTATLRDVFVLKLAPNGNFIWAKSVGGSRIDVGNGITADANNNLLITGYFSTTADFDPGSGVFNMSTRGTRPWPTDKSAFALKLDSNGNFVWAKGFISTNAQGIAVAIDDSSNVLLTGNIRSSTNLNPDSINVTVFPSGEDFYVVKLNSNGGFEWGHHYRGSGSLDRVTSIAVDDSNKVYFAGGFGNTLDFDPSTAVNNRTAVSGNDGFVSKLSPQGTFEWVISHNSDDWAYLRMNEYNEFYFFGRFRDSIDIDFTTSKHYIKSKGVSATYITKYDQNGGLLWGYELSNPRNSVNVFDLTENDKGEVFYSGYFNDTLDMDPGVDTFNLINVSTVNKAFLSKLNELEGDTLQLNRCKPYYWQKTRKTYASGGTYRDSSFQRKDTVVSLLVLDNGIDTSVTQLGRTLMANDSIANAYQWLRCDSNYAVLLGDTNRSFTSNQQGWSYAVEITKNGCKDTSNCFTILTVGLEELKEKQKLLLYPNPTSGTVTLERATNAPAEVYLFNALGQLITSQKIFTANETFSIDGPAGIYILRIHSEGIWERRKVVKN